MTKETPELEVNEVTGELKGSVLGTFIQKRYQENRDVKIIVTAKGSATGVGKTTLAIFLCYYADAHGWSASEKGFIDVNKYISKYKEVDEYSALLIDEIEQGADSRRAMAQDNVDLSHAWAQLRYRNCTSVATLPSRTMVDSRLEELADIWINVVDKGKAIPFRLDVNDFTQKQEIYQLRHPRTRAKEVIAFPRISNRDYKKMQKLKDETVRLNKEHESYDKSDIESAKKDAKKEKRDELIRHIYYSEHTDMTQKQLAKIFDLSQSMIGVIANKDD